MVDLLEEMWGEFAEARDADPDVTSPSSLARLGQLIADNRTALKAVADAAPGDEDVERAYRAFMHSYWIDDLTARIVEAQGRGLAAGLEPELAGEALGWMAERLVTQSLDRDPRQVLDTIVAILFKCLYSVPAAVIDPAPGAGRNRRSRSAANAAADPSGAPRRRREAQGGLTPASSGQPGPIPDIVVAVDLADIDSIAAQDRYLAVVTTARSDGTIQASVVNAGVLAHPVSGQDVVGFVTYGPTKLSNLRRRPHATVVFRAGWQWGAVEGTCDLISPDDPYPGFDAAQLPDLLRAVFQRPAAPMTTGRSTTG